jgi:hypothetical protein
MHRSNNVANPNGTTGSNIQHPSISQDPSQTSTRCVSCGSCSLTQYGSRSIGGKGTFATPRLGHNRGATGVGLGVSVGELGVVLGPRENGESEGPVSFQAALFGLHEEGSEGKGSPEIGVDTVGYGQARHQSDVELDWAEKSGGEDETVQVLRQGE